MPARSTYLNDRDTVVPRRRRCRANAGITTGSDPFGPRDWGKGADAPPNPLRPCRAAGELRRGRVSAVRTADYCRVTPEGVGATPGR